LANTTAALKEIRKASRRRIRNRLIRTSTRTRVKNATRAIVSGETESGELMRQAMSALDKAAAKGVFHKNAASRRKARLAKKLKAHTRTT
jgi:small subunit ribosomal protein S20